MNANHWLMLVTSLPGASATPRMRVWRALKARGAAMLRDGVHLLPATPASGQLMREQAGHVSEAGGRAYVIDFEDNNGWASSADLKALFDRSADYAQWHQDAVTLMGRLMALDEPQSRRQVARLRRELEIITGNDYFPNAAGERARATLAELESAVNARFSPDEPSPANGTVAARNAADYQGKRWATRKSIWVDRIACAWLIRRFIDRGAEFVWLARIADCSDDALGFDFDGATFSHTGQQVSFEVLMHSFALHQDAALVRLGALVHYLDVGGTPVPEAAGFLAMLAGAKRAHSDDDQLLDAGAVLLDHLYTAYGTDDEP